VTSSGEEVYSGLSSNNILTAPQAQAKRFLTSIYDPVGLLPAVHGTGMTAPVLLLTQTPETGGTNPVDPPPTQQSQQSRNPDGTPPPGVVSEPPASTTAQSTRGGGTGNRGKKRGY
jgi:hypothetical protein